MAKSIVVIGAKGFVGSFLLPLLVKENLPTQSPDIDIRDFSQVRSFFKETKHIDSVVLLAGVSVPNDANRDLGNLFNVNTAGVLNICQALKETHPGVHLIFTSTALVYKVNEKTNFLSETSEILPQNDYALSKLLAEDIIKRFTQINPLLKATILRVFNHTHIQQTGNLFTPSIVRQILAAKNLGQKNVKLILGNVQLTRDFSPVQNLAHSITYLIKNDDILASLDYFNICSGKGTKLENLVRNLAHHFNVEVEIETDPKFIRQGEPESIVGDNSKLLNLFRSSQVNPLNDLNLIYD